MKITDFKVYKNKHTRIHADPYGNNVAFNCFRCKRAVLAIARDNWRGSDKDHLTECRGCHARYFLDAKQKPDTGKWRWPSKGKKFNNLQKKGELYIRRIA